MTTTALSCTFSYSLPRGFWDFKAWSKRNELSDHQHLQQILEAVCDRETIIEQVDRASYMIYDEENALLIQPRNIIISLLLSVCTTMPQ